MRVDRRHGRQWFTGERSPTIEGVPIWSDARGSFLWWSVISSCELRTCSLGACQMEWTTPTHEEIDLNCEISSYANAEL